MRHLPGFLLLLFAWPLWAQQSPMLQTTRDQINMGGMRIPQNNTVFGFKGEPGKLLGTNYLDTNWHAGQVKFYRPFNVANALPGSQPLDSLEKIAVRYDILTNELEFLAGFKDVRAVKANLVRHFSVAYPDAPSRSFVNVQEYTGREVPEQGFFEILTGGNLRLLAYHSVRLKKASFNPALNVGSKDDELIKRVEWYTAKGKEVLKLTPGRKAVLELMADKRPQIEAYLKSNSPDYRSPAELIKLVNYYNTL